MPFGNLNLRTLKTHLGLMVLCEEGDFFEGGVILV
jgi:hypothetical protein